MAITYTKPLKTIEITFMVSGMDAITVADTATDAKATNALAEFEAYKTMHIKNIDGKGTDALIPFHAVAMISVTTSSTETTKGDPYNCVANSEG